MTGDQTLAAEYALGLLEGEHGSSEVLRWEGCTGEHSSTTVNAQQPPRPAGDGPP